jgi:hypothetical protein
MNELFEVHKLNKFGLEQAQNLAAGFDVLLQIISQCVPESRELSLVKTKLEEASFFAKKGMAKQLKYQDINWKYKKENVD